MKEADLDHLNLPDLETVSTTFYYPYEKTDSEEKTVSGAKTITSSANGSVRYYIKIKGGAVFDPFKLTKFEAQKKDWQYVRVAKEAFDYYVKFLNTKSERFLRYCERSII